MPAKLCRRMGLLLQLLDLLLLQPVLRCFLQPARLRLSLLRDQPSLLRPLRWAGLTELRLAASWVPYR
jgi:hypothetical protein